MLTWHHNFNKSKESKIRDYDKAINYRPEWLDKPKGSSAWNCFSNVDGKGEMNKPEAFGGIGDARLNYFIFKESRHPENKTAQLAQYKNNLASYHTKIL